MGRIVRRKINSSLAPFLFEPGPFSDWRWLVAGNFLADLNNSIVGVVDIITLLVQ